jgi:hypothetical protein
MKKTKITESDVDREWKIIKISEEIKKIPHEKLLRIYDAMSRYIWSDDLPSKPEGWEEMSFAEKDKWSHWIVKSIEQELSRKTILRHHHTHNLGRTEEQFNDWWDSKILSGLEDNYKELCKGYYRHDNRDDCGHTCVEIIAYALLFCLGFLAAVFLFRLKG